MDKLFAEKTALISESGFGIQEIISELAQRTGIFGIGHILVPLAGEKRVLSVALSHARKYRYIEL